MNEAARMIEQGIATPEDIDAAVRYGFGFRYATMGVVEFIDFGGLDILYHASRYLDAGAPATTATPRPTSSTRAWPRAGSGSRPAAAGWPTIRMWNRRNGAGRCWRGNSRCCGISDSHPRPTRPSAQAADLPDESARRTERIA